MIRVGGKDPAQMVRRMRDGHAAQYEPLISALVLGLLFESELARDDRVHWLWQSKRGMGSWKLQLADGREFHFRPTNQGHAVVVYPCWQWINVDPLACIRTEKQAYRFMRSLRMAKAVAA